MTVMLLENLIANGWQFYLHAASWGNMIVGWGLMRDRSSSRTEPPRAQTSSLRSMLH